MRKFTDNTNNGDFNEWFLQEEIIVENQIEFLITGLEYS